MHEVVLWHVCQQSPPEQFMLHAPPVHSWRQSPDVGQMVEHDTALVQTWWQSPPGQVSLQVEPAAQEYWQSPLPGHVSVHESLAAQLHMRDEPLPEQV